MWQRMDPSMQAGVPLFVEHVSFSNSSNIDIDFDSKQKERPFDMTVIRISVGHFQGNKHRTCTGGRRNFFANGLFSTKLVSNMVSF